MLKNSSILALLLASCLSVALHAQPTDTQCYELRIYTAETGKLNDLLNRFRNHTMQLFEKHGMTNVGYWTPIDNPEGKLYYILSYPNRAAREKAWTDFSADTVWQRVVRESEANGKLVAHVDQVFLKTTDFSPNNLQASCGQVWEFRMYTPTPGRLDFLLNRFRRHTLKLFEQYGMTSKIYWTRTDDTPAESPMLYYFLTHASEKAGKAAFDRFRADPEWQRVRKDSETEAGGSLTTKVESIYLYPTDFSPLK